MAVLSRASCSLKQTVLSLATVLLPNELFDLGVVVRPFWGSRNSRPRYLLTFLLLRMSKDIGDGWDVLCHFLNDWVLLGLVVGFPSIVGGLVQFLLEGQLAILVLDLRLGRKLGVGLRGHIDLWLCWRLVMWWRGSAAMIVCLQRYKVKTEEDGVNGMWSATEIDRTIGSDRNGLILDVQV